MADLTFTTDNTTDGLTLFGRSFMPETPGAVISLVHGLGEHSGRYAEMAARLGEDGIGMNLIDLRGHGESPGNRGACPDIDLMLDDVDALIHYTQTSQPGLPHFLMGHSMGGMLVLAYGLKRETEGLAGIIAQAPAIEPVKPPPGILLSALQLVRPVLPGFAASNGIDPALVTRDPARVDAYVDDPLVHDKISVALALDLIGTGKWVLDHAGEWRLPLLLLHGGDDAITSRDASAQFARAAGDPCTFETIAGGYHEIHNDPEREGVFRRIAAWVLDRTG